MISFLMRNKWDCAVILIDIIATVLMFISAEYLIGILFIVAVVILVTGVVKSEMFFRTLNKSSKEWKESFKPKK